MGRVPAAVSGSGFTNESLDVFLFGFPLGSAARQSQRVASESCKWAKRTIRHGLKTCGSENKLSETRKEFDESGKVIIRHIALHDLEFPRKNCCLYLFSEDGGTAGSRGMLKRSYWGRPHRSCDDPPNDPPPSLSTHQNVQYHPVFSAMARDSRVSAPEVFLSCQ